MISWQIRWRVPALPCCVLECNGFAHRAMAPPSCARAIRTSDMCNIRTLHRLTWRQKLRSRVSGMRCTTAARNRLMHRAARGLQGVGLWASSKSAGVRCDVGEGEAVQGRCPRQSRLPVRLSGCSSDHVPPNPSLRASASHQHGQGAHQHGRGGGGGEAVASVAGPSTRIGGAGAGGAGAEAGGLCARGGSSEARLEVGVEEAPRQAVGVPQKLGNSTGKLDFLIIVSFNDIKK